MLDINTACRHTIYKMNYLTKGISMKRECATCHKKNDLSWPWCSEQCADLFKEDASLEEIRTTYKISIGRFKHLLLLKGLGECDNECNEHCHDKDDKCIPYIEDCEDHHHGCGDECHSECACQELR